MNDSDRMAQRGDLVGLVVGAVLVERGSIADVLEPVAGFVEDEILLLLEIGHPGVWRA